MNKKYIVCYETDASRLVGKAEKVVFPESIEEIQKIIKTSKLDIVPRGAGTSLLGGGIPDNSIVVDMNKMNKIIDFDKKEYIVYVEAGISIKELNEKLNALGFEFPVQLNKARTIGGMVARNVSGSRSMKYGKIKDWVEEIEFVNGRGELMKTSKTDLTDVCGMEGITGIIVKVKLKVTPKIKRSISVFQTSDLDDVLSISRRLKLEKDVVMLRVFSESVSEMLNLPKKYNLVVEFDSDRGKIKGREYEKSLDLKAKAYDALFNREYFNIEDVKLFFDKIKEFALYLETNQIPYFAYLGSGIVYCFFRDDEENKKMQTLELMKKMNGKFVTGTGIKRKDFLEDFEKKIIKRVKLRHDPFGKLNKAKIIDFDGGIDRERAKPFEGEKLSADKFEREVGEKTPEEKMSDFIEEVGGGGAEEKEQEELGEEKSDKKEDLDEAQEILKDYKFTYESELAEPKRKKVEEFAKDVAWNVVKRREEKKESEGENK